MSPGQKISLRNCYNSRTNAGTKSKIYGKLSSSSARDSQNIRNFMASAPATTGLGKMTAGRQARERRGRRRRLLTVTIVYFYSYGGASPSSQMKWGAGK